MKIKKVISGLLSAGILAGYVLAPNAGSALDIRAFAAEVAVNESSFPDAAFRGYVLSRFDSDGNGVLSDSEIANAGMVEVNGMGISSLQGIEYLTNVRVLQCMDNSLTSLDISKNTSITQVYCSNNRLSSLNVGSSVKVLNCYKNNLTAIDVSGCPNLDSLYCYQNQITSLNVSNNPKLKSLQCYENQLTSIDVSGNTELVYFACHDNDIKTLDVSNNRKLEEFYCSNLDLSEIDVTNNPNIMKFKCYPYTKVYCIKGSAAEAFAIEWNLQYESVEGEGPDIPDPSKEGIALDETNFPDANFRAFLSGKYDRDKDGILTEKEFSVITTIDVYTDDIASVKGIENFPNLNKLYCRGRSEGSGKLTSLDTTGCPGLVTISCENNQISSLDISKNTSLSYLKCSSNSITELNVRNNDAIDYIAVDKTITIYGNPNTSVEEYAKRYGIKFITGEEGDDPEPSTVEAPASVTAAGGSKQVVISWSAVDGASKYKVQRLDGSDWKNIVNINITTYTDEGLKDDTEYSYRVLACVNDNWSEPSAAATARTDAAKPVQAPAGISAEGGDKLVAVTWTAVDGASQYKLYRLNGSSWQEKASVNTTTYTDTGLEDGTEYSYRVTACVGGQWSAPSPVAAAKTNEAKTAEAPSNVSASGGNKQIVISWNAVNGASQYKVQRLSGNTWQELATIAATTYTDKGLNDGTEYSYRVLAYVDQKWSEPSSAVKAKTDGGTFVLVNPDIISAEAGDGKVTLTWKAVTGASKYGILILTMGKEETLTVSTSDSAATKSYTVTGLTNGTQYGFAVKAYATRPDNGESYIATSSSPAYATPKGANDPKPGELVKVYRLYNTVNQEHLFTTDTNEVRVLVKDFGWNFEGSAWSSPSTGTPVYRLYCTETNAHLYTTDVNEKDTLKKNPVWSVDNDEKPVFYSAESGNAIYRVYNEGIRRHLLTTNKEEYDILTANGWNAEGLKFYCSELGDPDQPMPEK